MPDITSDQWLAVRGRIYAVLGVVGPLLAFYGVASEAEVALWVGVISAALGNGLGAVTVHRQLKG